MTEIPFYWLDIFTSEPFKGNPAAVCMMRTDLEDSLYQNIAKEIGLSETAFVEKTGESEYKLRWFTPAEEAFLCGHATIATAYTLADEYNVKSPISFHTPSGVMIVEVKGTQVTLNFPIFSFEETDDERILEPLGVNDYIDLYCSDSPPAFFVVLEDQEQVRRLKPDFRHLRELCDELNVRGVVVTSKGDGSYAFMYRVFGGGVGIDEDPGTGIAQCLIAPYWRDRLGKAEMRSLQLSERGSEMSVEVLENGVRITGVASPLIKGTLSI